MIQTEERDKLRDLIPQAIAITTKDATPRLDTSAYSQYVYLLQRFHQVPLGYHFKLYVYGPQCEIITRDLNLAASRGEVNTQYDRKLNVTLITPGSSAHQDPMGEEPLARYNDQMTRMIKNFGHLGSKELNLRTSAISIWNLTKPANKKDQDRTVELIRELKPHQSEDHIRRALEELIENGYI